MMGESIFALDLAAGAVETVVGPFAGESDDLVFTDDGDLIWTAVLEGAVRMRTADGRVRDLATGLSGANSISARADRGQAGSHESCAGDARDCLRRRRDKRNSFRSKKRCC